MMKKKLLSRVCFVAGALAFAASAASAAAAGKSHDYPTSDRVLYVQACMQAHPGHFYEMLSKCSCVLDTLATEIPYDDFVSMSTLVNANSIGGERGGVIRDNEPAQEQIKRYKALQSKAQKHCFLEPDAK
jgi:hypothetical protein